MGTLKLKKGNLVARITNRQDGNRDLSVYEVRAAGRTTVRVCDYGRTSNTANWSPERFTTENSFVVTEADADEFLEEMRALLKTDNRTGYFALVERTAATHMG